MAKNWDFLKVVVYMLTSLFIFLAGGFCFWFFQDRLVGMRALPSPSLTPVDQRVEPVLPEESQPAVVVSPRPAARSDLELIKEALAEKHGQPVEAATVSVNEQQGLYAQGGVRFEGEVSGAWWLAYQEDGQWLIVADGNGTVPCEAIEPYNFPVSMVSECWDEASSSLVIR